MILTRTMGDVNPLLDGLGCTYVPFRPDVYVLWDINGRESVSNFAMAIPFLGIMSNGICGYAVEEWMELWFRLMPELE